MAEGATVQLDAQRAQLHEMWESVAGGWAEHAAFVDDRGARIAEELLEATAPQPGERVLELACGPGGRGGRRRSAGGRCRRSRGQ